MSAHEVGAIILATPAPITHRTAEENLGLAILTAQLRAAKHTVHVVDGWLEGLDSLALAQKILLHKPPLWIGFSCYRTNMHRALETIRILRSHECLAPVVAGGFGPTFEPEIFLRSGFDVVAIGEAETSVVPLAQHFLTGSPDLTQIPGIAYLQNGAVARTNPRPLTTLDASPLPARDTLALATSRKSAIHVESARGCLASCTFCSIVAFTRASSAPKWRQKSLERVVDELAQMYANGVRVVKIVDDSFIEPPRDHKWAASLAEALDQRGIKLLIRASIRADRVNDELLMHLRHAGFFSFSCGIESYSQSALKRMAKSASVENNINALELFWKHSFYVQAGHILFDHATTMEELRENLAGMRRFDWTISKGIFTEMFAAAGTAYTRLLGKRSLLTATDQDSMNGHYQIADTNVLAVYHSLKRWQKSHSPVYDKAIDILSAPKAVEYQHYEVFHGFSRELRHIDLNIFEAVLNRVTSGDDLDEWLESEIVARADWYRSLGERVDAAYSAAGIAYDGGNNPFI